MNRRDLFRFGGTAVIAAPLIGARELMEATKPPPPELPKVEQCQVLTADWLNNLVDAVNELRAGQS